MAGERSWTPQVMHSETNVPAVGDEKLLGIIFLVLIYAGAA